MEETEGMLRRGDPSSKEAPARYFNVIRKEKPLHLHQANDSSRQEEEPILVVSSANEVSRDHLGPPETLENL